MPQSPDLCECRVDQHRSDGVRRLLRGAICIPDKNDPLYRLPKLRFRPLIGEADGIPFTKEPPTPTHSDTIWDAILTMFPDICPEYVRKVYEDLRKKKRTYPDGRSLVEAILQQEHYPRREIDGDTVVVPRKVEEPSDTRKDRSYLDTARKLLKMDSSSSSSKCTCGASPSPASRTASPPAASSSSSISHPSDVDDDDMASTAEKYSLSTPTTSITTTTPVPPPAPHPAPAHHYLHHQQQPLPELTLLTYQPPRSNPSTACRGSYQPPWPTATPPLQGPGSYQPPWATAAFNPLMYGKPPASSESSRSGVVNIFNWQLPCRRNPVY